MLLAFDTSSSACTAALFDGEECIASRDELIGRGHAERLVPMIAEMIGDRRAAEILVGVGPGSFTGIRVAIAAAHGLAIGWNAKLSGMSSLALLAASAGEAVSVAVLGGHGELFVQNFDGAGSAASELRNLAPVQAAAFASEPLVIGSGAGQLVDLRGWGEARDAWPWAANSLRISEALRSLDPRPVYARAPDAQPKRAA